VVESNLLRVQFDDELLVDRQVDREALKGRLIALPKREDINLPVNEQLIVELYSK